MRTLPISALLVFALGAALASEPDSVRVKVPGMVCSFCAQAIRKRAGKNPNIEKLDISLEKSTVSILTKRDHPLSDAEVRDLLRESGFEAGEISRGASPDSHAP